MELEPAGVPLQTAIPTTTALYRRPVHFACHMAVLSGAHARNSRAAMQECFTQGAERFEIDVHSLDGPDYVVSHERKMERETDRAGSYGHLHPDDVRASHYTRDPADRPMLLSEVVEMARDCSTEVQLDLKDWRPLSAERMRVLLDVIAPIKERVVVSSMQDWNLRRLNTADPELRHGFDPGHYFDHATEGAQVFLPRTMGAYGYRDDHPLAVGRTEPVCDYLEQRMEMLLVQAPNAEEFFLSYRLVLQMLDDGFNSAEFLHAHGRIASAWTPDYQGPESIRVLQRLVDAGFDRITTNTTLLWTEAIARENQRRENGHGSNGRH